MGGPLNACGFMDPAIPELMHKAVSARGRGINGMPKGNLLGPLQWMQRRSWVSTEDSTIRSSTQVVRMSL